MAFDDVRFPPVVEQGASGGPEFSTSIVVSSGGHEQRQANWSVARRRWNIGTGLRTRANFEVAVAFFIARQGRLRGFRFKDWSDYAVSRQTIGTTDGATATFQIIKTYTSGAVSVARDITRPVSGTVSVWVNSASIALGAGAGEFQVNTSTGIITLGSTLAATTGQAVEAACEFDVPVRFDTDELPLQLRTIDVGQWPDIPIVELRE